MQLRLSCHIDCEPCGGNPDRFRASAADAVKFISTSRIGLSKTAAADKSRVLGSETITEKSSEIDKSQWKVIWITWSGSESKFVRYSVVPSGPTVISRGKLPVDIVATTLADEGEDTLKIVALAIPVWNRFEFATASSWSLWNNRTPTGSHTTSRTCPGSKTGAALRASRAWPGSLLQVGEQMASRRFTTFLLSLFAATALVITGVGLYGLVSYLVTKRRREFGIRVALGAQPRTVLWIVVSQVGRLAAYGLVVGSLGTLGLGPHD